jgi:hypothetical protein
VCLCFVEFLIFVCPILAKRGRYKDVVPQRQGNLSDEAMYTCACQMWREAVIEDAAYSVA